MIPNMNLAEDKTTDRIEVFYNIAAKYYGIRKCEEVIKDGVHIEATKSLVMTREQLEKLMEQASTWAIALLRHRL